MEKTPQTEYRETPEATPAEGLQTLRASRDSLPIALLQAREAIMFLFRPILAKHDITEQQWRIIRLLHERGILDASDVASQACILAPSLTRMIRSLETRDIISRHKDEGDGRRVLLKLEPAGEAIIRDVLPDNLQVYAQIEQHFGKDWMADLLERLNILAQYRIEDGDRGV